MNKPIENQHKNTEKTFTPSQDVEKMKHKREQNEVAGRHKNDGQKGHKGAR